MIPRECPVAPGLREQTLAWGHDPACSGRPTGWLGETVTNPTVCGSFGRLSDDGGQQRLFPIRKIFDTVTVS